MKTVLDIIEEDDRSSAIPTDEETRSVAGWVSKVQQLNEEVIEAEARLKSLQGARRHIVTTELPLALQGMGVERMDVAGLSLTLRKVVSPNVRKDDESRMHEWLVENGHGDLVKHRITIEFGRGEKEECDAVARWLDSHAVQYSMSVGVHRNTLGAWAKTMVEEGVELPAFFNLYLGEECVIKERK